MSSKFTPRVVDETYKPDASGERVGGRPPGGGEPPNMKDRIEALEAGHTTILSKLDDIAKSIGDSRLDHEKRFGAIDARLASIDAKLDAKAAKSDLAPIEAKLGTVDGSVRNLPGTPTLITLVMTAVALSLGGAAGLAFTLFKIFKP